MYLTHSVRIWYLQIYLQSISFSFQFYFHFLFTHSLFVYFLCQICCLLCPSIQISFLPLYAFLHFFSLSVSFLSILVLHHYHRSGVGLLIFSFLSNHCEGLDIQFSSPSCLLFDVFDSVASFLQHIKRRPLNSNAPVECVWLDHSLTVFVKICGVE